MIRVYLLLATLLMAPFQDLAKNEDERFIRLVKIGSFTLINGILRGSRIDTFST